jgi:hypothetical protein
MDDLLEELIVAGLFQFAAAVVRLVGEVGSDIVGIVAESRGAHASSDAGRLIRLRRWNERVRSSSRTPSG